MVYFFRYQLPLSSRGYYLRIFPHPKGFAANSIFPHEPLSSISGVKRVYLNCSRHKSGGIMEGPTNSRPKGLFENTIIFPPKYEVYPIAG